MDDLRSQKLHIPNLWPAFEGWKRGVNPLSYPVRHDAETGMPFGDLDTIDGKSRLKRILKDVYLYRDQLEFTDQKLAFHVNKLVVCTNELFSLKKELKDRTGHMNLILITMYGSRDLNNLDAAGQKIVNDIHSHAAIFNRLARTSQFRRSPSQEAREQFDKMVAAYQAVVTAVLHFSIESPRYGILLKDRLPLADGGFLVTL